MGDYKDALNDHYGQANLSGRIQRACEKLGIDPETMTLFDMSNFDQVHIRGLEATLEIGEVAGLKPGMRVLDLGAGLGGPARTLAAEFGCEVVGVEIVKDFLRAAVLLTEWAGLTDRVSFHEGDMRVLPFPDGDFDRVITQHSILNVKDKETLFAEVRRVLKPGGGFFLYEVCGDSDRGLQYPVPWAAGTKMSFLVPPEDLRALLVAAGFTESSWTDVTARAVDWFDGLAAGPAKAAKQPRGPGIGVVLGPDSASKSRNVQRNLREGKIQLIQGMFIS